MEKLLELDTETVLWLNQWAGRSAIGDALAKLIVSDYLIPVSLALCLLAMWLGGRDRERRNANQRAVLAALIAMGFANLVVLILNQHYFRPRPIAEHELTILFYWPTDSSFPANPSAVAFAIASGVWQTSRKLGTMLLALAVLWGVSRVYAGVFYPTDVAAGALIGIGMSLSVAVAMRLIEPVPTLVLRATGTFHLA